MRTKTGVNPEHLFPKTPKIWAFLNVSLGHLGPLVLTMKQSAQNVRFYEGLFKEQIIGRSSEMT